MAELDTIAPEARDQVESLGAADLVIALPACGSPEGLQTIVAGLSSSPALIQDRQVVLVSPLAAIQPLQANGEPPLARPGIRLLPYPFVEQLDSQTERDDLRSLFLISRKLGARACAVQYSGIDPATAGVPRALVEPVLEQGYDLAAPYYARRKFDGLINSAIVYPLTRALYGKRIHYPMAMDQAFSARLVDWCCKPSATSGGSAPLAWMTVNAVCAGLEVCQVSLGVPPPPPKSTPELSTALAAMLDSLFLDMNRNAMFWQRARASQMVPMLGAIQTAPEESPAVDVRKMIDAFQLGCRDLAEIWGAVLSPAALIELRKLARTPAEQFRLPDHLWARLIYDFALGHRQRVMNRDHLLRALTPAYLGWVASYVLEVQDAGPRQVEERLDRLCLAFEAEKPYLLSRWRWPDRFNP
ncbi:MAG TPA: hypothetical protein VMB25_09440 [Bryobacteraceae bacterium]|nr:hypothetical protein [Bryobacteraceae bacterium]